MSSFLVFRYNGSRSDDIYYYPNVIAHDSDTTCSIIWMTIIKVINVYFIFSKAYYSQLLITAHCLKRIFLFRRLKEPENYFIMCIYNLTILRERIKISSSSPFVLGLLRWTLRKKFESDFNKLGEFPIN